MVKECYDSIQKAVELNFVGQEIYDRKLSLMKDLLKSDEFAPAPAPIFKLNDRKISW